MNAALMQYMIVFASSFWLDRWTKSLAIKFLSEDSIVVNALCNFSLQWNKGVSFGWFSFESPLASLGLLLGVLVIIVLFTFYTIGQYRAGKLLYGETLVLAGALSNIVDRFKHGAVVDYIDLHIGSWHFAVFNVADMCICIGITWLILTQVKEVYDAKAKINR